MVINGKSLFNLKPFKEMLSEKKHGTVASYGLSEAGYDIRIKQNVLFTWDSEGKPITFIDGEKSSGHFALVSCIEEFQIPSNLVGIIHDKSTWARQGLSVLNTVAEPNWKGFLTAELVFHGNKPLEIPAGSGIAQVIFHLLKEPQNYDGKYQNQENKPVEARMDKDHF